MSEFDPCHFPPGTSILLLPSLDTAAMSSPACLAHNTSVASRSDGPSGSLTVNIASPASCPVIGIPSGRTRVADIATMRCCGII